MANVCRSTGSLGGFIDNNCLELFTADPSEGAAALPFIFSNGIIEGNEVQYAMAEWCGTSELSHGVCLDGLNRLCNGYSRNSLDGNPLRKYICGCYLGSDQYLTTDRTCDGICSSSSSIPYVDSNGRKVCGADVCVIDNVTINAQSSKTGAITFSQICPACLGSRQCLCILSDIDIIASNKTIVQTNVVQNCDQTSCFDSQGREVPCSSYSSAFGLTKDEVSDLYFQQTTSSYLMLILVAVSVGLFFFILLTAKKDSKGKYGNENGGKRQTPYATQAST